MSKPRTLGLVQAAQQPSPPANRGRLLYVEDIASEVFRGRKSAWWIRHNVAPAAKIKIGRDCAWYENDVYAWLDSQRVIA